MALLITLIVFLTELTSNIATTLTFIPIIYAVGLREVENETVTVRKLGSNKTTTVDLLEEINEIIPNCKIPD